ncbi:MAG: endopeptidase La [Bacilli bacterium]|nr:endopeptidase La [Bacilli bacterium]MDD3304527.1 endopeptidase La [Bacilli bacterium]MDD4053907.1 endopeptidase La [Bacilli bacterium]MDD4411276.1 endopeptidase La [Bacilli bacterium]
MVKTSLPVILLRGVVLLPYSEIRLEVNNDIDREIFKLAEENHNNNILIVPLTNPLDESLNISELPKIAVIGKINLKMELQNGLTRAVITGLNRVSVYNYSIYDDNAKILKADIGSTTQFAITPKDEAALTSKLIKEFEIFIENHHEISNGILSEVMEIKNIAKATDVISAYVPTTYERKIEYLKTVNPYTRLLMLLEDIKKERQINELEQRIDTEVKKQLDDSQKEYILREKLRVIKAELGEVNVKDDDIEDIRKKISAGEYPVKIKERLHQELKKYELLSSNSPEISLVRNYIDWLLNLPWKKYTVDNVNMVKTREVLDASHYGLDKIKDRIIEFLAVRQMKKDLKAPVICLVGPPGVGKTSLAKSIAESMGRKFVKISVGGVSDEAEIRGHRRAYVGANPGRIISGMKKAGSSNPIFLIDEIDKMGKDYKGDPASALLEVLDQEQNHMFYDNYIEEEYDLSQVLFVLTANYSNNIPEPLRDRLEVIELTGYTEYEKLDIVKKHILPKELDNHGLTGKDIEISDKTIMHVISYYTKEAGVREIERLIATLCRKVVTNIVNGNKKKKTYKINEDNLETYLGKKKYFYTENDEADKVGVANGLAYTQFGGDILPIEVTYYKGKGNLVLTGSLGDVMKESANIALSYLKSHYDEFGIDYKLLVENDIHIHLPEGAIPKDGPSAGITLVTALISVFTNKTIDHNIGMTGEITLHGQVLPIGGLKEKAMGAHRSGLKKIIIPKKNERDLDEVPKEIKKDLEFIFVNEYKDVYKLLNFDQK